MPSVPDFETGAGRFSPDCSAPAAPLTASQLSFEAGTTSLQPSCNAAAPDSTQHQPAFETGDDFVFACNAPAPLPWQEQTNFETGGVEVISPCGDERAIGLAVLLLRGFLPDFSINRRDIVFPTLLLRGEFPVLSLSRLAIGNQPPDVQAGASQVVQPGKPVFLAGTVTDDGLPVGGSLTHRWSQVSGPATARFASDLNLTTGVTLPVPGMYVFRLSASDGALSSSATTQVNSQGDPLYQGNFVLMLVLDETGSIGNGGAQRGVDIIDAYGDQLKAIGWVSFGNIICQSKAPTTDLVAARAELAAYADGSSSSPFFCDGGGDTPENGTDALNEADMLVRGFAVPAGTSRYIHLVTDTTSYAHNVTSGASVYASLASGFYNRVYIEANPGDQETQDGTLPQSVDTERRYFIVYSAGQYISHIRYTQASITPDSLSMPVTFPAFDRQGGGSGVLLDALLMPSTFPVYDVGARLIMLDGVSLGGSFPPFDMGAHIVQPATVYLSGNFQPFTMAANRITLAPVMLLGSFPAPNFYANRVKPDTVYLQSNIPYFQLYADRISPAQIFINPQFYPFTATHA